MPFRTDHHRPATHLRRHHRRRSGAPLVLLLHGFAESMHCWRAQVASLGDMGYRASRRASAAIRRARGRTRASFRIIFDRLMDDAMAIVAASGYGDARFHLVGHDWGGSIAWGLADRHHARLASLTILSRPHPNAFNRALHMIDGDQAKRSRHHKAFLEPDAADVVLADDAKWLRDRLSANGVPAEAIERILPCSATRRRWRRRSPGIARAARSAARSARSACPRSYLGRRRRHRRPRGGRRHGGLHRRAYQFEVLPGVGHFAADQAPDRVSELLLAHVEAHPA